MGNNEIEEQCTSTQNCVQEQQCTTETKTVTDTTYVDECTDVVTQVCNDVTQVSSVPVASYTAAPVVASSVGVATSPLALSSIVKTTPVCTPVTTQQCNKVPKTIQRSVAVPKCVTVPKCTEVPHCVKVPVPKCSPKTTFTSVPRCSTKPLCNDVTRPICKTVNKSVQDKVCRLEPKQT